MRLTPLTGGVSSDIWRVDLPAGRSASSARWPSSRSRRTGARRSSATPTRSPGCETARGVVPGRGAASSSAHDRGAGAVRDGVSRPARRIRCGRAQLRDGERRRRLRRARSARGSPRSMPRRPATPTIAARFPTDAHLPRDPARALSRGDGRAPSRPRRAGSMRAGAATRAATKLALVHGDVSPKNILVGPARAGVPRRRMRLVRRPGLRPRLLPQPSAAEMPVDAARPRRASSPASTRSPAPISPASTWEPRGGARGARGAPAAGPVPRARRRQVAGRVPHRRTTTRARAARSRGALIAAAAGAARRRSRDAWAAELGAVSAT